MGLFSSLDIGYSGLNASQVQMETASQNISNADTEGYSRERVVTQAQTPLDTTPGAIGSGVKVQSITRIHNEYVFDRLKDSANSLEYNQFSQNTLQEVAKYFPDTDGVGLQNDMKNYFDSWNSFASNPTSSAEKTALAQSTTTFTDDIKDTRKKVRDTQDSLNDQLKVSVDEVNSIGKKIADLNAQISNTESVKGNHANDLRDQRDKLELSLSKLMDVSVYKGNMQSDMSVDPKLTDGGDEYYLNIAGESFVDGSSFHPLVIDNNNNKSSYYTIYHESQDGSRVDMSDKIHGGKIGAILDLRGRDIDPKTSYPTDGKLQGYIDNLDAFSNGLIQSANSVYAESAVDSMESPPLDLKKDTNLLNSGYDFKKGSFDVIMYDNNGNEIAKKTININENTTMDDGSDNSIVGQFNKSTDDNGDNDSTDDIDDYFEASYSKNGDMLSFWPKSNSGYKIAIEDNGTNFAGATGINAFFDGDDASNISLKSDFKDDPSKINAYQAPVDGDNTTANDMLQVQYKNIDFQYKDKTIKSDTIDGFYRNMTTQIATDAENSGRNTDTSKAIYNAANQEQQSVSGVNLDEELANLMKYQTAYGANAKVITTIDKMLDSLLSIKQ